MSTVLATSTRTPSAYSDEPLTLLHAFRRYGDAGARDRLIELLMPLVRSLAKRYANRGERFEDLVQIGSIGLLAAIERFDPERGRDFVSFAAPTIAGEIRHHLRDRAAVIRIPRRLAGTTTAPTSLSVTSTDDASATVDGALATDGIYDSSDDRLMLAAGFRALASRERRIMHLRFFAGLSQDEIAREVGISQVQVSRLIRSSLERMRGALAVNASGTTPGQRPRVGV